MTSNFSLQFDSETEATISKILSDNENCDIAIQHGIREIWFRGAFADSELRILFLGTERLTVSRVSFHNRRCGTMTKVFRKLMQFCVKNHVRELVIQSVETPEMESFCKKNGLSPNPSASFEIDGCIFGDWVSICANSEAALSCK